MHLKSYFWDPYARYVCNHNYVIQIVQCIARCTFSDYYDCAWYNIKRFLPPNKHARHGLIDRQHDMYNFLREFSTPDFKNLWNAIIFPSLRVRNVFRRPNIHPLFNSRALITVWLTLFAISVARAVASNTRQSRRHSQRRLEVQKHGDDEHDERRGEWRHRRHWRSASRLLLDQVLDVGFGGSSDLLAVLAAQHRPDAAQHTHIDGDASPTSRHTCTCMYMIVSYMYIHGWDDINIHYCLMHWHKNFWHNCHK